MARKHSTKAAAGLLPCDSDVHLASVVSDLLAKLNAHEESTARQTRQVARIARQIEHAIRVRNNRLFDGTIRSKDTGDRGSGKVHDEVLERRAQERSDLIRFSKLL